MKVWLQICLPLLFISSCYKEIVPIPITSSGMTQSSDVDDTWKLEQNRWTYSQMKSMYFWEHDIPDSASLDFSSDPFAFFDALLSDEDRFSYMDMNQRYKKPALMLEGMDYQPYVDASGKTVFRVMRVVDSSQHEQWRRGDWFICKSGRPVRGMMTEQGVFEEDSALRPSRIFTNVFSDTLYNVGGKAVGYILYDDFNMYADFIESFHSLRDKGGVDELILDLRYNPGGYVDVCRKICSQIMPAQGLGKLFQLHRYNEYQTHLKVQSQGGGSGLDSLYFADDFRTRQVNLNLPRLYVLTTRHTASASEALIHCLRPYMDVITVGTTSRGKNVGGRAISDDKYRYALHPITFQYTDAEGVVFSSEGIQPDIYAEDDLNHELGDVDEAMLSAALSHISGESPQGVKMTGRKRCTRCPVESGKSSIEIKNNL